MLRFTQCLFCLSIATTMYLINPNHEMTGLALDGGSVAVATALLNVACYLSARHAAQQVRQRSEEALDLMESVWNGARPGKPRSHPE